MKQSDIQASILRIFAQHRETPDAPFEQEKFLDFLMADNRPLSKLRNSFRGLWRLNGFYDALQLECVVCFEDGVAEKSWSASQLAAHIAEKKKNPAAQKALVNKRLKRAERNLYFEPLKLAMFVIGPLALVLYAVARKLGADALAHVFPVLGLAALGFCCSITRREAALYRKLRKLME